MTASAETPLLPCPFCGPGQSHVDLWHDDVANRWRVGCGRCGCSTGISPRDKTQAPAIDAWNRRAASPAQEQVVTATPMQVKPLEWEFYERSVRAYMASDECGWLYHINQSFVTDGYYFATVRFDDGATLYDGDDLPAAKAAAQADYERRINSALVTADDRPALMARIAELEAQVAEAVKVIERTADIAEAFVLHFVLNDIPEGASRQGQSVLKQVSTARALIAASLTTGRRYDRC